MIKPSEIEKYSWKVSLREIYDIEKKYAADYQKRGYKIIKEKSF